MNVSIWDKCDYLKFQYKNILLAFRDFITRPWNLFNKSVNCDLRDKGRLLPHCVVECVHDPYDMKNIIATLFYHWHLSVEKG